MNNQTIGMIILLSPVAIFLFTLLGIMLWVIVEDEGWIELLKRLGIIFVIFLWMYAGLYFLTK